MFEAIQCTDIGWKAASRSIPLRAGKGHGMMANDGQVEDLP